MKKLVIIAIAFLGLVPFVNADTLNVKTNEDTTISISETRTVSAIRKNGGITFTRSLTVEGSGNNWVLYEGNKKYTVYERETTIKGTTYTHVAGPWAFFL